MPPYWIAMASTWLQIRHVSRRTRRILGLTAVLVAFVSVLPYFLHFGPGPAWLGELATKWAASRGIEVTMASVRLRGWGEVVIDGAHLAEGWEAYGLGEAEAERLHIRLDWRPLLAGEAPRVALVRVESPRVEYRTAPERLADERAPQKAPAVSPGGDEATRDAPAWEHPVAVEVRDARVAWHELGADVQATLSLRGTLRPEGLTLEEVQVELAGDPIRGRLVGEGEIRWEGGGEITASGNVRGEALRLEAGGDVYHIERAQGEWMYHRGAWEIPALALEGAGGRVELSGAIGADGRYEFAVTADGVEVAESVPVLARLGFAGEATFVGTLTGTGRDAVLYGDAVLGPGRVWGRLHESTAGRITLTPERLDLHEVEIRQRVGLYHLEGSYVFGAGEASPGRLDLRVTAHGGQAEDLLAVLGGDELPVAGRIDGRLHFAGPLGGVTGAGEVTVSEAVAWGQRFDRVTADFTWAGGRLHIVRTQAEAGPGRLRVEGDVALDGSDADIRFVAEEWSLGETAAVQAWSDRLGGRVDVRAGRLTGSVEAPRFTAEIASETLRIGTVVFHGVEGVVHFAGDDVTFEGLQGTRSGGGVYTLDGVVRRTVSGRPTADLTVVVHEESLSRLLRLAGQELPALLLDGSVSGRIDVSGAVEQPEAHLDLRWEREGDRNVELVLRLAEGSVQVERFDYSGA